MSERQTPDIAIVVAIARNGVIGTAGGLPWHLSADMKRFKALTMGKPLVMGRKTWDSFPRPLPGRPHIVVTRQTQFNAVGAEIVHSLDSAFERAATIASASRAETICVIGGRDIYAQAIGRADLLHVTHVEADVSGDTLFEPDLTLFEPVHEETVAADERNDYPSRYVVYRRSSS